MRIVKPFLGILLCFYLGLTGLLAQAPGYVKGKVKNEQNEPVSKVVIQVLGTETKTTSDENGLFAITLPSNYSYTLEFRHIEYGVIRRVVAIRPGAIEQLPVVIKKGDIELETQEIYANDDPKSLPDSDRPTFQPFPISSDRMVQMPMAKMDESVVRTLPGVATNNEFSSQFRVRGGNFDENLIYVNGIEIYRPFLIRSGQSEGLGFVNANLTSNLSFSTGGFEAQYADKLSSVLDVQYKNPGAFRGSAEAGILTQSFHVEGSFKKKNTPRTAGKFTYLMGGRRFSTTYLLNSLDTQGDYKPVFYDYQGLFSWKPRQKEKSPVYKTRKDGSVDTIYFPQERLKFSAYVNIADNDYHFIPHSQETQFGTVQNVLRLRVGFAGEERMGYRTGLAALTIDHRPSLRYKSKFIFTGFRTRESEEFTVEGGYFLSDVNTNFGNEGFNEVIFDRGIGTNFRNARNYLNATVLAGEMRSEAYLDKKWRHNLGFGVRVQQQVIDDELNEWNGVDSAGYFFLQETIKSQAHLNSTLFKAYVQDNWKLNKDATWRVIFGSRAVYNTLNDQLYFSPRAQLIFDPTAKKINTDTLTSEQILKLKRHQYQLHFATGMYQQPPFYREMRAFDGTVYTNLKAQTSIHFIAGGDYLFRIWNRPFKLFGEAFYKKLYNLIPYEIDNVRVRYYPQNVGEGYAYGLDLKVNGEFLKDVDSWVSIGLLKTMEDIPGDGQGYVSRPTDQRFSFAMYFQDELPMNPTYKVHINFVYGSGLRIGPPRVLENRTVYTMPSYQRVDLGFSKVFYLMSPIEREDKFGIETIWVSLELFNLFQRANTVSYTWIKDIYNTQFGVPNFLSARLLNLRVMARF
ncbi:MAG: carboxypeptidase-like regulatory domain-containing protein [Bacteroidia bacterium]|nr:carboxypeptidase-like regulatory domain-containing protein [Bacteroidia bacterium]